MLTEDEGKLLEEITHSMANQRMRKQDPFTGGLPKLSRHPHLPFNSPRTSNTSTLGKYMMYTKYRSGRNHRKTLSKIDLSLKDM